MVTSPGERRQGKRSWDIWIFLCLLCLIFGLTWGLSRLEDKVADKKRTLDPFLQVTNREFALFLWQNPQYMRVNNRTSLGYLPQFSSDDDVRVIPDLADDYLSAPQDVIFRYHVWNRLIAKESLANRPIAPQEFRTFLDQNKEWQPQNWPSAPSSYRRLVMDLEKGGLPNEDLQSLPKETLPFEVRLAFQGWKNFFREWTQIQNYVVTYGQLKAFLQEYPHYARNYWINILHEAIPKYLESINQGELSAPVPEDELSLFLKIALYNASRQ